MAVGGFSHLSTPWGSVSTRNVQVSESKRNLRVIVLSSYPFKNTVYGDPTSFYQQIFQSEQYFCSFQNPCVGWCLYRGAYEPTLHVLGIIIIHEHGYPQWNPLTSPYKSQFLLGKSHNYLPIFVVHHEIGIVASKVQHQWKRQPQSATQLVTVPVMLSKTPWLIGFYGSCTAKVNQAILITHSYQPASINQLGIGVMWKNQ